jgi:hypothetical protein
VKKKYLVYGGAALAVVAVLFLLKRKQIPGAPAAPFVGGGTPVGGVQNSYFDANTD